MNKTVELKSYTVTRTTTGINREILTISSDSKENALIAAEQRAIDYSGGNCIRYTDSKPSYTSISKVDNELVSSIISYDVTE